MPSVSRSKPGDMGQVLSFMRLLWAVTQGVESTSKRMLAQIGITGPQRMVLRIVGHWGPIYPGDLAEILHVDPSSLTGVLARLEKAGFLKRRRDPRDGRRALLTLSAEGR
ncbi:MAG TPA: MarR family transcriptional regulator, partial [Polyangiaceae bacterium]